MKPNAKGVVKATAPTGGTSTPKIFKGNDLRTRGSSMKTYKNAFPK